MKYIGRFIFYLLIFFAAFSVSYVLALRFIPVTFTPLKAIKLVEHYPKESLRVRSKWRSASHIDPVMLRAVVASEDNHFFSHYGFDWEAIRQALRERRKGKPLRGASTISQQTAKNVFCLPTRSWVRKGVEGYFTVLIECMWSKRRIAEVYLNIIETHPNVYGVESASELFFGKTAETINAWDASLIAAVLPNPKVRQLDRVTDYLARRSRAIRRLMAKLPPMDFDGEKPPAAIKNKNKR